jgi:hypothetical protein
MNKRIDLTKNGGFPATQFMLNFMQESYRSAFMALAALVGEKVVIQGMDEVGGAVTNGWLSYGGELIPFTGGLLVPGAEVKIIETPASRVFDNGATNDVYYTKQAVLGTPGNFLYSDLKRVGTVLSIFTNLTQLISDFNSLSISWNDLTDRPSEFISYRGSFNWGDNGATDVQHTVAIPDQGDANYHVVGSWVGNNSNWDFNDDLLPPNIFNKTSNSFQMGVREINAVIQNVRFEFIIIKSL